VKPERAFIAERALAQHCAELLKASAGGSAPGDLLPALGRIGTKLSRTLAVALSPLVGGQELVVRTAAPREANAADLTKEIASLAANSLLGLGNAALLASFDAAAVLRMIDRAFGGAGKTSTPLPAAFPASVGVVIRQLETIVAQALAVATGTAVFDPMRRNGNLADLEAFADETALAVLTLTVEEAGAEVWPIHLALPLVALEGLVGEGAQAPARPAAPRQPNPTDEPYADLPLTLSAVIVDMRLPMSTLTELAPGTLLPVSVARNIPLRVSDKTVAYGVIGSVDDRVAIQITQAF
jgi:flagellar motor switch protein FliM